MDAAKEETKTYIEEQVKNAAPRNLLDNSDFTNPVNQRGNRSYTAVGYTIDRWLNYAEGLTVKLQDGYLELINTTNHDVYFIQKLYSVLPVGKRITLAFGLQDGSKFSRTGVTGGSSACNMSLEGYSVYYNVASGWITFHMHANATVKLKWVALYEGEYTIDTLPEYQPKGYGAELAECQRYYIDVSGAHAYGVLTEVGTAEFVIPIPVSLRFPYPSFSFEGSLWAYKGNGGVTLLNVNGAVANSASIRFFCTAESAENSAIIIPDILCTVSADL